jgi:DNA replication protein DnaC
MSLDGKILSRARKRLDAIRTEHEAELARRAAEAYSKNPKLAVIDSDLRSTVADAVGYALMSGGDPYDAILQLGEHNIELQEERRMELLMAGLPENWLDDISCPHCHDTGRTRDGICSCLMELYAEEQKKELSLFLKMGQETFDTFDINYYSTEKDPASGISPQENMEIVYETCIQYARLFGKHKLNLFFAGAPGLGKTFLSTCIAREVSEAGFSVVYGTASDIFAKYEDLKFGRGDEMTLRSDIARCENCDLLILDDLGT